MRKAEEILRSNIGIIPIAIMDNEKRQSIFQAINQARREAIIECTQVAKECLENTFGIDFLLDADFYSKLKSLLKELE